MHLQTLISVTGNFLVKRIHYHSGELKYLQFNNGTHLRHLGLYFDIEQPM